MDQKLSVMMEWQRNKSRNLKLKKKKSSLE